MTMGDGFFAAIDATLEKMRRLSGLAKEGAPAAASAVGGEIRSNIASQRDAYHKPWKPTKDGGTALSGAASHVRVAANGTVIMVDLSGVEVLHHIGKARGYHGGSAAMGGFRRGLIPTGSAVPGPTRIVLTKSLGETFNKIRTGK
jgi:hypothetical protein